MNVAEPIIHSAKQIQLVYLGSPKLSDVRARILPMSTVSDQAPYPATVNFAALKDPKLKMLRSIPLTVSRENSNVIVTWAEIDEFGVGGTLGEAMDDFGVSVRELHRGLHADSKLGEDLQKIRETLDLYISARS